MRLSELKEVFDGKVVVRKAYGELGKYEDPELTEKCVIVNNSVADTLIVYIFEDKE